MPSFGKIVGAVSENEPERTDERTNGGDSIGPFGFQPGTNNECVISKIYIFLLQPWENTYKIRIFAVTYKTRILQFICFSTILL